MRAQSEAQETCHRARAVHVRVDDSQDTTRPSASGEPSRASSRARANNEVTNTNQPPRPREHRTSRSRVCCTPRTRARAHLRSRHGDLRRGVRVGEPRARFGSDPVASSSSSSRRGVSRPRRNARRRRSPSSSPLARRPRRRRRRVTGRRPHHRTPPVECPVRCPRTPPRDPIRDPRRRHQGAP